MASDRSRRPSDRAREAVGPFAHSESGRHSAEDLRIAFERSRHPMLIADDQRRWITGNAAACELLQIAPLDVPWRTMDEFTPPSERPRLEEFWQSFLASGAAEGWYHLYVPERGQVPVEFSTMADVLPARHLSIFIPTNGHSAEQVSAVPDGAATTDAITWRHVAAEAGGREELTEREREVIALVAAGMQNPELAERLFVSQETIKSHVHNAMGKLGAHTRAHAVAIALVSGQISADM